MTQAGTRLVATTCSLLVSTFLLAGSTIVVFGQEASDPRIPNVVQRFCIKTFPGFVPSPATIADFSATGDDPGAPPRINSTGSNRTWSIPPLEGETYNLLVQTYFGEVNGEAASGCSLSTSGEINPTLADRLQRLFPGQKELTEGEPDGQGMTRQRSLVEIAGETAVWTIMERDDPPHNGFEISLELLPKSLVKQMQSP